MHLCHGTGRSTGRTLTHRNRNFVLVYTKITIIVMRVQTSETLPREMSRSLRLRLSTDTDDKTAPSRSSANVHGKHEAKRRNAAAFVQDDPPLCARRRPVALDEKDGAHARPRMQAGKTTMVTKKMSVNADQSLSQQLGNRAAFLVMRRSDSPAESVR